MSSVAPSASLLARHGSALDLAALWPALRAELLAAYEPFWPQHTRVAERAEWNLPLWELGHVAWFAERWTLRQLDRHLGPRADPARPLPPGNCRDDFYDSSAVPHARRWQLPLPDRAGTVALLAQQLEGALGALRELGNEGDDALYPFRLSLLHEAMHLEAARLLARSLGLPTPSPRSGGVEQVEIAVPALRVPLGHAGDGGFAFDNELQGHAVEVATFRVDARARLWRDLLPWLSSPAWHDDRLWSEAGQCWRRAQVPRDLAALDPDAPAEPLSAHEAEAWCRWAGRRLLSEAEWLAASGQPGFAWGEVWEWTAEPFASFAGFPSHPYRDYSAPWFDGRHRLLKGASRFTPEVLRDVLFRNFYLPGRSDLVAGLRTAAIG
ncbi:MAG: SUMF1/EgtB/PvdO family nonheme iron enzyme [Burkholderiales bacterium]|nr:SUMF1/EgtB/PvdO family nonheme iron enzyme [Burkholderiales bacterium]